MKKTRKLLTFFSIALFALQGAVSQEFDDFGTDDFGSSDFGDFGDSGFDGKAGSPLTFGGKAEVYGRAWIGEENHGSFESGYSDFYDVSKSPMEADAVLEAELKYEGSRTDFEGKLLFDVKTIKEQPWDILEEFSIRSFFGNFQIEAGKIKNVWGKGDKLHVLDNFNANNYTDFVFKDYLDRRLAEPMLKLVYASPYAGNKLSNLKLEGIWTPMMTADRFAEDGMLVPATVTRLTDTVTEIMKHNGGLLVKGAIGDGTNVNGESLISGIINLSDFSQDDLYEDNIKSLKYGQAGIRFTGTLGSVDFGASYYYGHYKQPSANLENYIKSMMKEMLTSTPTVYALPSLNYDQLQVFGLEAAFVTPLIPLNTRWEFAYNLTEDTTGDNPWVKNNSISWLGGFDIDIPLHNLNLNVQEQGTLVLKKDKIEDGKFAEYDVDFNSKGKYTSNKLVVNISDKFLYDKLTTECTVIWGIEGNEWCIQPKVSYDVIDGLTFTVNAGIIYSDYEDGEFYNFTANSDNNWKSFVQLSAKYKF